MSDRIILNQEQVGYVLEVLLDKHSGDKIVEDAVSVLRAAMLSSDKVVGWDKAEMVEKVHEACDRLTEQALLSRDISGLDSVEELLYTYDQRSGHAQRMKEAETVFDRNVEKRRKRRRKHLRHQLTRVETPDVDDEFHRAIERIRKRLEEIDPLTKQEARRMLVALRERMMAEHPEVPRERGLLRKEVLRQILYFRITNDRELKRWLGFEMKWVHPSLYAYLPEVFKITSRIQRHTEPDAVTPEH